MDKNEVEEIFMTRVIELYENMNIASFIILQASRKICGAVKSGVREFAATGFKIMTGCTMHPAPGEKFCSTHSGHASPALSPDQISSESLRMLNKQHSNRQKTLETELERDNIFVVKGK